MATKKEDAALPEGPVRVICLADNVWTLAGKLECGQEGVAQPHELAVLGDRVEVVTE